MMKYLLILALPTLIVVFFLLSRSKRTPGGKTAEISTYKLPMADPNVFTIRGFDFYVLLKPEMKDSMLITIREAVGCEGTVYDQGSHAVVLWNDFNPPERLMKDISETLKTDVIWLVFQKQVDAFGYQHWQNGTCLRRLAFGCYEVERTWEEVGGNSETWEDTAIFDEQKLEQRLAFDKKVDAACRMNESEVQELLTIWREHRLEVGSEEPNIDGRDVAEAVAVAYCLPGWE